MDYQTFDEAVVGLQSLLARMQRPSSLAWVFRGDVTRYRRQYWVRWPPPETRRHDASQEFARGIEQGLGLALEVIGFTRTHSLATVYVPQDEQDASDMMLAGLHLKVATFTLESIPLSRWLFRIRAMFNRLRPGPFTHCSVPQLPCGE